MLTQNNEKQQKIAVARKRLYKTRAIKLVWIWLVVTLQACGISAGETCWGTTGYLVEHNRKVAITRNGEETTNTQSGAAMSRWAK